MINITELRHSLHKLAELSGQEKQTSLFLHNHLKQLNPDQLFTFIGGTSLIAVFDSFKEGDTILFRADMDALPISEHGSLLYKSETPNVSHKCGHDGHSAILFGLAQYISANRPTKGKAILLWQSAEETGEGAASVVKDIEPFKPAFSFAMHNLPGFETNSVVVRNNTFASASEGMIINLKGKQSHASEPENGNNPGNVLGQLILEVPKVVDGYSANLNNDDDYCMVTLTHARLGEPSLGISPAEATLMLTLRGSSNDIIDHLKQRILILLEGIVSGTGIAYSVAYSDAFPATSNDTEAVDIIINAAGKNSLEVQTLEKPFRWSEDFAHYGSISKAALFGIGAGIKHFPLHNAEYDFPDEIIPAAVGIWKSVYEKFLL